MKMSSLVRSEAVFLSRSFIAAITSVPRATGANSSDAEVGDVRRSRGPGTAAEDGPQEVGLLRGCRRRPTASPPRAGRRGWCPCRSARRRRRPHVGLGNGCDVLLVVRRVGQGAAVGPALVAEPRLVLWPVAARLVGQQLEVDVRVKPRNASAWSLPALTMPLDQAGELRGVLREHPQLLGAPSWSTRMMLSPFCVEERARWCRRTRRRRRTAVQLRPRGPRACCRWSPSCAASWRSRGTRRRRGRRCRRAAAGPRRGRDLRVDPLEVAVEGLEVLAELLAAALERGGQRVERLVELGRLDRAQQRVEVVERSPRPRWRPRCA